MADVAFQVRQSGTISKKQLCTLLGYYYPNGRCDHFSLNTKVFDDKLLLDLGLDREKYKKTRIFNAVQTRIIIGRLKLDIISPSLKLML